MELIIIDIIIPSCLLKKILLEKFNIVVSNAPFCEIISVWDDVDFSLIYDIINK